MSALGPENLEEHTIEAMLPGDIGWTVPRAMWVDRQRRYWLHPYYTIHEAPGGTGQLRVTRTCTGFHVEVPPGERYSPEDTPSYVGSGPDMEWLPVDELVTR